MERAQIDVSDTFIFPVMHVKKQTIAMGAMILALLLSVWFKCVIFLVHPRWHPCFNLLALFLAVPLSLMALVGSLKWPFSSSALLGITFYGAVLSIALVLPWLVIIFLLRNLSF